MRWHEVHVARINLYCLCLCSTNFSPSFPFFSCFYFKTCLLSTGKSWSSALKCSLAAATNMCSENLAGGICCNQDVFWCKLFGANENFAAWLQACFSLMCSMESCSVSQDLMSRHPSDTHWSRVCCSSECNASSLVICFLTQSCLNARQQVFGVRRCWLNWWRLLKHVFQHV